MGVAVGAGGLCVVELDDVGLRDLDSGGYPFAFYLVLEFQFNDTHENYHVDASLQMRIGCTRHLEFIHDMHFNHWFTK